MSMRSIVWTVVNAIIWLTKILKAVTVHGYKEENDVKSTCGGTRLEFKIEIFFIENLTRQKILYLNLLRFIFFNSKSDALYCFQFKIWRVVFFSIQNLTRKEICNTKSCFLKKHKKMQNMPFSRSKMDQNVIFWVQTIFQNVTCRKICNSKSNSLYFFQSNIWRVVKLLNQNLNWCFLFILKSNTLYNFYSKSAFQNHLFRFSLIYYESAANIKQQFGG